MHSDFITITEIFRYVIYTADVNNDRKMHNDFNTIAEFISDVLYLRDM